MTQNRRRKARARMRGSKTFGYGAKKKHRGGGHRGGRGFGGSLKQKKQWVRRWHPDHFAKQRYKSLKQKGVVPADAIPINLFQVERLANGRPEIDLTALGFGKVLGSGVVSKPITVKGLRFSKQAKAKIEQAGGKAVAAEPQQAPGAKK